MTLSLRYVHEWRLSVDGRGTHRVHGFRIIFECLVEELWLLGESRVQELV